MFLSGLTGAYQESEQERKQEGTVEGTSLDGPDTVCNVH